MIKPDVLSFSFKALIPLYNAASSAETSVQRPLPSLTLRIIPSPMRLSLTESAKSVPSSFLKAPILANRSLQYSP